MKTYFLKASELNDKFTSARKYGREAHTIQFLVKPTCLIIDEVGRCGFNRDDTAMFFDLFDGRYEKEGPHTIIFTSNNSNFPLEKCCNSRWFLAQQVIF